MIPPPYPPSYQDIPFMQFLFPQGAKKLVEISRPKEIAAKALALMAKGFVFEIENKNEVIWMTAIHKKREIMVDRICGNGPEVAKTVDSLINETYRRWIDEL